MRTRSIRCIAVGRRITPPNRPIVGRIRDLCATISLVHTEYSGVWALLSETSHTTLARVADWALAHPH